MIHSSTLFLLLGRSLCSSAYFFGLIEPLYWFCFLMAHLFSTILLACQFMSQLIAWNEICEISGNWSEVFCQFSSMDWSQNELNGCLNGIWRFMELCPTGKQLMTRWI